VNCYRIHQKSLNFIYPFKFYSNFTNKNVSWLHFSWPTRYTYQYPLHINSWGVRSPAYPLFRRPWLYELQISYTGEERWPALLTGAVISKPNAVGRCSSHHVDGPGHCGGPNTGSTTCFSCLLCIRPLRGDINRWCASDVWRLTSVCLSVWRLYVAYIGPRSRTERPRLKLEQTYRVAHVTRDSDTTFKVKNVKVTRPLCSPPCWRVRRLQRWAWERVGRGKLLILCRLLGGAKRFGANGERRGAGHIVAAARLQLVQFIRST